MCDPLTIAAVGLSTAGGIGQAQTQSRYVDAVNRENKRAFEIARKARLDEQARQDSYQGEADTTFNTTKDAATRENYDVAKDAAATDFVAMLDNRPDVLNTAANFDTASNAVKTAAAARTSKEAANSRERIKALANLNSYGTTGQGRARTFQGGADFLSMLGGLRRGSLGVANQEQGIPAANVTPGDSSFAQMLSGAGTLLGMAGPGLFGTGPLNAAGLPTAVAPAGTVAAPTAFSGPMLPSLY